MVVATLEPSYEASGAYANMKTEIDGRWEEIIDAIARGTITKSKVLEIPDSVLTSSEKQKLISSYGLDEPEGLLQKELRQALNSASERRRIDILLGNKDEPAAGIRFRISHEMLLAKARAHPPKSRTQSVTGFSKWVYSLYTPTPSPIALELGRLAELEISVMKKKERNLRQIPLPRIPGWKLVFSDRLDAETQSKPISKLRVNGSPIFGVPDLVIQEVLTNRLMIIERKFSAVQPPLDAWPNVRAQLWAYSQIDDWLDVEDVTLVGEVWNWERDSYVLRATHR